MVNTTKNIGFIGLGAMGWGMAQNLKSAGKLHYIYNRTLSKAAQFCGNSKVQYTDSISELAEKCTIIFMCVSTDEDVIDVLQSLSSTLQPGSVIIDSSTISKKTALKADAMMATKHSYYLDAPVSGGVEGAKNGTLSMMVGGDASALKQVQPILGALCDAVCYMGATGTGQATKAVNQIMAAGINQAVTQALAFAQAENLPLEQVIEVISGGAAGNWFLSHRGNTMINHDYKAGFKVALHHKDLNICQAMADENYTELSCVTQTLSDYQTLIDQGFANEDISALFRLKSSD